MNDAQAPYAATKPMTTASRETVQLPLYKVLLHNDDHNTMDHVTSALVRVFGFDARTCERIMLEAHRTGVALCALEPVELAELHRDQLTALSLIATIEPE